MSEIKQRVIKHTLRTNRNENMMTNVAERRLFRVSQYWGRNVSRAGEECLRSCKQYSCLVKSLNKTDDFRCCMLSCFPKNLIDLIYIEVRAFYIDCASVEFDQSTLLVYKICKIYTVYLPPV